jgi:hypothetical protein
VVHPNKRVRPVGPAIVNHDVFQMPEELEQSLWHPNYVRLHRWWEILDLCHRDYASERGEVPLHHLNNLPTSLAGGPPTTVASSVATVGTSSSRGHRLVLKKSVGRTSPTSVHNRYIVVRYYDSHKK